MRSAFIPALLGDTTGPATDVTDEMIEAAAKRIHLGWCGCSDFRAHQDEDGDEFYVGIARCALRAALVGRTAVDTFELWTLRRRLRSARHEWHYVSMFLEQSHAATLSVHRARLESALDVQDSA